MKKYFFISILFFVYIFLSDFLIHGVILKQAYLQTASFWRSELEMQQMFKWMVLGQASVAFAVTCLYELGEFFSRFGKTISFAGAMFVFRAASLVIMYVVEPYPFDLVCKWIGLEGVQIFLGSILLFVLSRNRKATV